MLTEPSMKTMRLVEEMEASTTGIETAVTLPAELYTSESFFEFEKDAIFMKEWICLGRQEQIPNSGDYFTFTIADEPLVVVRDELGAINVMSSVCQHRAMVITDPGSITEDEWHDPPTGGSGSFGMQMRCPYHFWVYDLRGQLVGAPEMGKTDCFAKEDVALPSLKVEIWNGFIFASFDPDAEPLAPRMRQPEQMLENWHIEDMVVTGMGTVEGLPWNWKVMFENVIEIYHADRLHLPIHEMAPASRMVMTPFDPDDAMVVSRARTTRPDYSFNATEAAVFPVIDTLTDEDRAMAHFGIGPPTLSFGTSSDSLLYLLIIPRSATTIDMHYGVLVPKEYLKMRRFNELSEVASGGLYALTRQDVAANASVQRGLRSRFAPRGRYSWQEEPLAHFNKWLVQRYRRELEV
jgi:phenylpropionate dioxygenase-like ring-hydroxylating dioxygenase large terminal subunit